MAEGSTSLSAGGFQFTLFTLGHRIHCQQPTLFGWLHLCITQEVAPLLQFRQVSRAETERHCCRRRCGQLVPPSGSDQHRLPRYYPVSNDVKKTATKFTRKNQHASSKPAVNTTARPTHCQRIHSVTEPVLHAHMPVQLRPHAAAAYHRLRLLPAPR